MNLNHDTRAAAHEQLVPLLIDGRIKEANDIARAVAGEDWRELVAEARLIAG